MPTYRVAPFLSHISMPLFYIVMPINEVRLSLCHIVTPLLYDAMPIYSIMPSSWGAFYGWGEAIFNPFQWVFDTSPQFIRGRVRMQNYCAERLAE